MSDRLDAAVRALYESRAGASPRAATTRRRIVERAQVRKRRRRLALLPLSLAATLVLSTAWAAENGRLPGLLRRFLGSPPAIASAVVRHFPTSAPRGSATTGAKHDLSSTPEPMAQTGDDVASAESTVSAGAMQAPALRPSALSAARSSPPRVHARPRAAVASRRDATAPADRTTDVEESSYARAHQAHFVDRDWTAALRAWDSYLQAYPSGRLALEAMYNRALALVHLGRMKEARDALAAFAGAPVGSYRQREARALVDVIDARASSER
jgi:hypothetical protein